jgi:hypothetical protein
MISKSQEATEVSWHLEEKTGPPTMLSAASPSPFRRRSALQIAYLGVNFLTVQMRNDLLAVRFGYVLDCFFGNREHSACAARRVIPKIRA